jgi:H+-translocating NAD(P) transhydrogenase subunit alpha
MQEQLSKAITEASEISGKAHSLATKLQEISIASETLAKSGSGVDPLVFAITIFTLACFVGYYVVWKVTPSLHTPLMSITNAISGIIIIGAMVASASTVFGVSSILGLIAAFFAAMNIFGGFVVTERMLAMFKKK